MFKSANPGSILPPLLSGPAANAGPGPVLIDRVCRIGARISSNRYAAEPELVAEAIHLASLSRRWGISRPRPEVSQQVRAILADALRCGPAADLMLLQLEFVEELPVGAVALLTGETLSEAYRRRGRAMVRLAEALAS